MPRRIPRQYDPFSRKVRSAVRRRAIPTDPIVHAIERNTYLCGRESLQSHDRYRQVCHSPLHLDRNGTTGPLGREIRITANQQIGNRSSNIRNPDGILRKRQAFRSWRKCQVPFIGSRHSQHPVVPGPNPERVERCRRRRRNGGLDHPIPKQKEPMREGSFGGRRCMHNPRRGLEQHRIRNSGRDPDRSFGASRRQQCQQDKMSNQRTFHGKQLFERDISDIFIDLQRRIGAIRDPAAVDRKIHDRHRRSSVPHGVRGSNFGSTVFRNKKYPAK